MSETNACPCGRTQTSSPDSPVLSLQDCCLPFIKGKKKARIAEDLLRSRYTAFTLGEVDFILDTHHSKTKHDVKREEIEEWSKGSKWLGLKIVQQEAGQADDTQGTIAFCAQYEAEGKVHDHWEQSYFEKENGEWKFLDAKGIQTGTFRRTEPKVGRNDPCPCGSEKKYKKCHGAA